MSPAIPAVRAPAVAGSFYPGEGRELAQTLAQMLGAAAHDAPERAAPKAIIAPHAGYIYSGPIAASVYALLAPARGRIRRVVLLGPTHRVAVRGMALPGCTGFATPLGNVEIDDAARPCLGREELDRLFGEIETDDTGGLLAVPVADTLKRANRELRVAATEPRHNLWLAQTPQMFRYRLLIEALRAADPAVATDEARAVEGLGLKPRLVMGNTSNIKVTFPEDLTLAELILENRKSAAKPVLSVSKGRQDAKKRIKTRTTRK